MWDKANSNLLPPDYSTITLFPENRGQVQCGIIILPAKASSACHKAISPASV